MPKHKDWLLYASSDLDAAKVLFREDQIYSAAFFLCQQAAEKALKAFLHFKRQEPRKTHDLTALLNHCLSIDQSFKTIGHEAESLNSFGSDIRYPDDSPMPDKTTLGVSIAEAERILKFVKDHLG